MQKMYWKPYSFLAIDATLASDNPLCFRIYHWYLTGEEILPSDQRRVIEQAKYVYSPLGKAFLKKNWLKIKEKNRQRHVKSTGNN